MERINKVLAERKQIKARLFTKQQGHVSIQSGMTSKSLPRAPIPGSYKPTTSLQQASTAAGDERSHAMMSASVATLP